MIQDIRVTFDFMKSVLVNADIDTILPVIQDLVIEHTGADRCKVVLFDDGGEPIIDRSRQKGDDTPISIQTRIASKIISAVLESQSVIVSPNAKKDPRFTTRTSPSAGENTVIVQNILSVACAPLWHGNAIFGVLYIDSREKESLFTEGNGDLLKGLADLIADALKESLQNTLDQRRQGESIRRQLQTLREEVDRLKGYGEIVGSSTAMRRVYELIEKVKDTNLNVLITGESGTGKELVARALHRESKRRSMPFVAVDCSVLSETILESALFGHEKGAFTGADSAKAGFIEEAQDGTLFFDEIGNISPAVQRKLLQFLDKRVYFRLGSTRERFSGARFVFATNKNLPELVSKGDFMGDLYYRIAEGIEHQLPPLRERGKDILMIARALLWNASRDVGKSVRGLSKEVEAFLMHYAFPGNVRELRQILLRALVNSESDEIILSDLPAGLFGSGQVVANRTTSRADLFSGSHDADTYLRYLPEEYRSTPFIWGVSPDATVSEAEDGSETKSAEFLVVSIPGSGSVPLKDALKAVSLAFERNYIIERLVAVNGKLVDAQEAAGVDKKTLIDKIKKTHGLKREWFVR